MFLFRWHYIFTDVCEVLCVVRAQIADDSGATTKSADSCGGGGRGRGRGGLHCRSSEEGNSALIQNSLQCKFCYLGVLYFIVESSNDLLFTFKNCIHCYGFLHYIFVKLI